ncbi:MAG TPA: tetratricopeptide repeat protein, partial [Beijerinckiaceae bacterium]|nr:tetratricopeptide repeat protein [Beijerinckiaceae bacterium]
MADEVSSQSLSQILGDLAPFNPLKDWVDLTHAEIRKLFEAEDFKKACCDYIEECGVRKPMNKGVYWCLEKCVFAAGSILGDKGKKVLLGVLEKTPGVSTLFARILQIARKSQEAEQVRQALLNDLRARRPKLGGEDVTLDHTSERQIMEFLYLKESLDGLPEAVRKQLESNFGELRDAIAAQFQDMFQPQLTWPQSLNHGGGIIDGLMYANERDPFVGREEELDLLSRLLGTPDQWTPGNRFRWLALVGPGGEGKSRLAMHFSKEMAQARGWDHGRLSTDDIARLEPAKWRPRKPTLITIDYAARRPDDVRALIIAFAQAQFDYDFPVRLLLLERDAGAWFARLMARDNDLPAIVNGAFLKEPHVAPVDPVMQDKIIDLMQGRFQRAGIPAPEPAHLLKAAYSVDRRAFKTDEGILPLPRPLFAAAAAEAMIELTRQGAEPSKLAAELDRDTVLAGLIARDRNALWEPACRGKDGTVDEAKLALHENLLLVTTIAQGLPEAPLRKDCPQAARDYLPDFGPKGAHPLNLRVVERMGGRTDGVLGQLEPDIVGEFFVLNRLAKLENSDPDAKAALIDAALALGQDDSGIFILRCFGDFQERTERLDFLRPTHIDAAFRPWSRALAVVGDHYATYANLEAALRTYESALEAARRSGDERDLSISHDRIGDVRVEQGDLTGALTAYAASHAIAERLAAADRSNTLWQRDLSISHDRIGDVRRAQGDLAGALTAYEASLAIRQRLAAADRSNTEWQRDLSVSHNRIGDVRMAQGDLAGALTAYEADLAIAEHLAAADRSNTQWQRDLSISHNRIGDVRTAQGDLAGALTAYAASLAIAERLAAADQSNTLWQRDLSISHTKIGDVRTAQGDLADALTAYEASLAIFERLAAADRSNTEWQRDLSISHEKIGDVRRAQGDLTGALTAY